MTKRFPLITKKESTQLKKSLVYLHIKELKAVMVCMGLPKSGKKAAIIERIIHYLETGDVKMTPTIPHVSRAQKGVEYSLAPQTKILHGAYINNLETRLFFKKLIGEHFHFTSFGQDWIMNRWLKGNPPTYGEYAEMWKEETARRKREKADPKQEWAYINFVQDMYKKNPDVTREEITAAWELQRMENVKIVQKIFDKIL